VQEGNHPSQRLCGWCGSPLHEEEIARQSIELEESAQRENSKIQELVEQLTRMQEKLTALLDERGEEEQGSRAIS
jgi:hypothetical protein